MAGIETLAADIQSVLRTQIATKAFGMDDWAQSALRLAKAITPRPPTPGFVREPRVLWPREIGEECLRKVWYGLHGSPVQYNAADTMKFTYGHLLEETMLTYAELAGHKVTKRQHKLTEHILSASGVEWQIRGKIDADIDDVVVDVKSCSKTMYADLTAYYPQVRWYAHVGGWKRAGILAVNKVNGKLRYEEVPMHEIRLAPIDPIKLDELDNRSTAPPRAFTPTKIDKIGGQLPGGCLFCPYKFKCWPGLKAYRYATLGPVFYTTVSNPPRVPEMTQAEVESEPIR